MISLHNLEKRVRRRMKLDENKKISDWLNIFESVAVSAKKKPKKQVDKFKAVSASKATPTKQPTKLPKPKPKPKPIEVKWKEIYCGDDEIECWCDPTWRALNGWNKVNIRLHYCGTDEHFEREYPATEKGKPFMITEDYGIAL